MGILEKIKDIEAEISRTQKNKATEHHLGILKAKLARFRTQLLEPTTKGSAKGEGLGFEVVKSGDARVCLVGFPSVGKSTILTKLTATESVAASYEFTTLTCIPGVINYRGSRIQLLDTPGIIEGAAHGKGRGRQVIAVAKTADLILMMLDASKGAQQRILLETELESVGLRLNRKPPNIYFKPKATGGIAFTATVPIKNIDERMVRSILIDDIWGHLDLVRVYTKRRGEAPSFADPLIMRQGATIEDVCFALHKDLVAQFKYALAWGRSAKHTPQRVGLAHLLSDEDVVQIVKK